MKKVFALLVVMAMLALPAAALAQGPGYGMPQGTVQTTIENGTSPKKATQSVPAAATSTPAPEQKGSLPFTGLQVGLVAIAGLALVGTGVGLRKLGGSHSS
jgi:hypothetical protein